MNNQMIWKNITRNKSVSFITVLFITAAAMLLSLSAILTVNLTGAIDQLMQDAKTPHFMQMHSGGIDFAKLTKFAEENRNVADFQINKFLNVDASQVILGGKSLSGNVQDNGISTQSERFDFLLDLNNEPLQPKSGELFVPVCYSKDGTAKMGDGAVIGGRPFVVAGFVRDSQMNSALASSKRFVVSEEDYSQLESLGEIEYLIEFRLYDRSKLGAFESAYSAAGLPAAGPTLTWPLFRIMNAISDGIMIAVLVLIGILVVLIALLCVRFTLLAKIEDDYREIGVMKAIGMRISDIQGIYLSIYAALAATGAISGFFLSLWLQKPMLEGIRLNLGDSGNGALSLLLSTAGAAGVFLAVLLYVSFNLRRFRKISAVQAIRFGAQTEPVRNLDSAKLSECKWLSVNFFLGMKDVLVRKRLYMTMLAVIVLASFIMIVPQNLYHTISDVSFVTYMGIGRCDLRIDIQQTGHISEMSEDIGKHMDTDQGIEKYTIFTAKTYPIRLENGSLENIKVELGDHTVFPLHYTAGAAPVSEHEIALSGINAEELGKSVGGQVILIAADEEKRLTVCGIYSDITNGGKTAKAVFTDHTSKAAWSTICATLTDPGKLSGVTARYANRFSGAKVSGIDEYMEQTFGQTLQSVRAASLVSVFIAVSVTMLVTLLFMKLLVAKDRHSIAVMRAIGFSRSDIQQQYAWRATVVLAIGIVLGTILSGTLGEALSSAAISSFGAAAFRFTINPIATYLFAPLIMLAATLLAATWGTCRAGDVRLYESIKE